MYLRFLSFSELPFLKTKTIELQYHFSVCTWKCRAREMAQWFESLAALQKTCIWFLTPPWKLINICDSSPRALDIFYWSPRTSGIHMVQRVHAGKTPIKLVAPALTFLGLNELTPIMCLAQTWASDKCYESFFVFMCSLASVVTCYNVISWPLCIRSPVTEF